MSLKNEKSQYLISYKLIKVDYENKLKTTKINLCTKLLAYFDQIILLTGKTNKLLVYTYSLSNKGLNAFPIKKKTHTHTHTFSML